MVVITVITFILVCAVFLWICGVIIPGVMMRREEKQELSPLIKEAKSLKLTYESVLKYPDKALGKPAIWCIQNRGPAQVFYKGKQDKRIFVSNDAAMPLHLGGKHSSCINMLVIIRESPPVVSGSKPVSVDFIHKVGGEF